MPTDQGADSPTSRRIPPRGLFANDGGYKPGRVVDEPGFGWRVYEWHVHHPALGSKPEDHWYWQAAIVAALRLYAATGVKATVRQEPRPPALWTWAPR